jgi:hypothetical protein
MIGGVAGSAIIGAGLKVAGYFITSWMESKRQKDLASLNADTEKIVAVQGGQDHADGWTKYTRRVLALMITTTACLSMLWFTLHPTLEITMLIPQSEGFFEFLFGSSSLLPITMTGGMIVYKFTELFALVAGFYFTKVGR